MHKNIALIEQLLEILTAIKSFMRYECFGVGNIIRGISRVADNWMSAQLGYLISHISTARVCTKSKWIQLSTCSLICPESFYRSFSVRCLARTVWTFQLVSSFLVPVHQCLYSPGKSTLISLPAHTHSVLLHLIFMQFTSSPKCV